ncbi:YXWGXW repeat-containing protein [Microvirga sp. 3-52]|nr:YXWGXW repeat-containing protein [Microvirga sp. 3-52]
MLSRRSLLNWLIGATVTAAVGTPSIQAQDRPADPGRPPMPRRFEVRPPPHPGHAWVPGRWTWSEDTDRWVWVPGHWRRRPRRRS